MRMVFSLALAACVSPAFAGKYNPTLTVGDTAPEWQSLPATDGETYSSADFEDARVVVVAFTCDTCPYAVDHAERLVALAGKLEGREAQLVAINCNSGEPDSLEAMRRRAAERESPFPYLKDESGVVGKAFGATRTPEFIVLDDERKVVYLGALDDDPKGRSIKVRYVEEAVNAALEGRSPAVAETPPVGCGVKYPRERRRPRGTGGG